MPLILQDPNAPAPNYLLDELEKHFKDADAIYCAFAFVTARGINLLFDQVEVRKNLDQAKIHLIVGMDAITDTKAIEKLSTLCAKYENFFVQVFLPRSGGIFHPKFSWIKKGKTGVVITGSGNLTNGGLKNNFEAFSVIQLDQQTVKAVENNWTSFLSANTDSLFSLDAKEVVEAAQQNAKLKKATKKIRKEAGKKIDIDFFPEKGSVVFIEELTKGRGGKQRDVGTWASKNYFEKNAKLFLTHVNDQGECEDVEVRKLTLKPSKNYAIDLGASDGLQPIDGNMPIAIFIRTRPFTYFYHIIRPKGKHFKVISDYLKKNAKEVQKDHARRIEKPLSIQELKVIWPDAPFWRIEEDE
ncbi:MAG TPA: phospholipase D family protein [Gallionella sp.]|nr:phospholipase D family protein [Gallionella sp.]